MSHGMRRIFCFAKYGRMLLLCLIQILLVDSFDTGDCHMLMGSGGKDVPVKLLVNSTPNEIVPQHLRTRPSNTDSSGFISLTGNCKESAISHKQSIAYSEIADFLGPSSAGIHEGEQYSIPLSVSGRRIRKPEQNRNLISGKERSGGACSFLCRNLSHCRRKNECRIGIPVLSIGGK